MGFPLFVTHFPRGRAEDHPIEVGGGGEADFRAPLPPPPISTVVMRWVVNSWRRVRPAWAWLLLLQSLILANFGFLHQIPSLPSRCQPSSRSVYILLTPHNNNNNNIFYDYDGLRWSKAWRHTCSLHIAFGWRTLVLRTTHRAPFGRSRRA